MTHIKALRLAIVFLLVSALFGLSALMAEGIRSSGNRLIYVGTYSGAKSKGIYSCRMDLASGALTSLEPVAETPNPTFLAIDAKRHFLFAANEIGQFEGRKAGSVSAFSFDPETGKLTPISQSSSIGSGPCHVLLDKTGHNILVANYGSGSLAVFPVQSDGRLGDSTAFIQNTGKSIDTSRQEGPHAHCMVLDAANRFVFACDLGIDKTMIYKFDSRHGTLTPNDPPFASAKPGAGPRHIAFHPNGRHAYVIHALNSTIAVFAYDPRHGSLKELQTISTLPDDFKDYSHAAEVEVHPSGKFLYGSNRGSDTIAVFAIDRIAGTLTPIEYQPTKGKTPRHFIFDPTGRFLLVANQDSDNIVVFAIDPATGRLKDTGHTLEVPSPACIMFAPPAR
jgi:6-phosphogluconolactonase